MKKSQSITLTIVAAMGMDASAQLTPLAQATATNIPVQTCDERRDIARVAGTAFTETCGNVTAAHGTSRGGFGTTGKSISGGG
jgi:hypothetical protein